MLRGGAGASLSSWRSRRAIDRPARRHHLVQEADVDLVLHQIRSQIVLADDRAALVDSVD
jgi:hypothetical protein